MLLHLSFVGTCNAKRGGFSAWLLISFVSTQGRPDLGWITDLSKAMYLDYLWCGELNLPLSVLCTRVNYVGANKGDTGPVENRKQQEVWC